MNQIKFQKLKQALLAFGLCASLSVSSCAPHKPYTQVELADLVNYQNMPVVVEGVPEMITDDGFAIRDGVEKVYVVRASAFSAFHVGDYKVAVMRLEEEISDGDQEPVKVIGTYKGKGILDAEFVEIERDLFPIYY